MLKYLLCILFINCAFGVVMCQEINEKKTLKEARNYLEEGDYDQAKETYKKLVQADPKNNLYHFELGLSYYNSYVNRHLALSHFQNSLEASVEDTIAETYFYLGKTHQYLGDFSKAKEYYSQFKEFIKDNSQGEYVLNRVDTFIAQCEYGIALKNEAEQSSDEVVIRNLGDKLNSRFAEYGSITNSEESLILFTTRDRENKGKKYYFDNKKYEDIYIAERKSDTVWTERTKVDSSKSYFQSKINTDKHDAVISFSQDESKLYIYKKNGIWVSKRENGKYQDPTELENINTKGHEPSSYLTRDGKTLLIVSNEHEGGVGGRDLFFSTLDEEGNWDEPKPLSSNINTSFNEDAPYLSHDEQTLFFSSTGHNSMGGYDVYKSVKDDNGQWGEPTNLGYGINSAADDIYYTQDSLGETGYFSSGRAYGYGDMDIYAVQLMCNNIPNTEIRGYIVSGDNYKPIEADFTVYSAKTSEEVGTFSSDAKTGKYLMILPPDNTYYLEVTPHSYDLPRAFKDTIIIPRQCEFYQMYQHVQLNKIKKEDNTVALEAVFDNAMLDIETETETFLEIEQISDAIQNKKLTDTTFNIKGSVMHNDVLAASGAKIYLSDEKGNIVQVSKLSNDGMFIFKNIENSKNYSILIDENGIQESYYGPNSSAQNNSIIVKGHIDIEKIPSSTSVPITTAYDSLEILITDSNFDVVNKTFNDLAGNFSIDNLPSEPVVDNRSFPISFSMPDEDDLYTHYLESADTVSLENYTIIKDTIDFPEETLPDIAFDPIYFGFDKSTLRTESKETLDKIYQYMIDNPEFNLEILGHTDWYGTDTYNVKLSKRRSQAAFDYLEKKGIDKSRLEMEWFGESEPAVPNANPDGSDLPKNRQLNRRCEFRLVTPETAFTLELPE